MLGTHFGSHRSSGVLITSSMRGVVPSVGHAVSRAETPQCVYVSACCPVTCVASAGNGRRKRSVPRHDRAGRSASRSLACRALRDRTGRRRNARHASEAGLANAAGRGALLLPGKGAANRDRWRSSISQLSAWKTETAACVAMQQVARQSAAGSGTPSFPRERDLASW